MKKSAVLLLVVVIMGGLFTACTPKESGGSPRAQTVYLKFPTAATTGTVYAVGAALANLWSEKIPNLQVSAEASNGGVQNLGLMAAKDAHVSVAVTSIITEQKRGEDSFAGRKYDGVRILSALYSNYNQVVVSGSSNINTLAGIKGKVFASGAPGSTTEVETRLHLETAGLNYPDDIAVQFVGFTEAVDLIRNRQMDGAWIQAGLPTSAVSEICSTAGGRLLSMDEDVIQKITARYPWYNRDIIPAGTYDNQTQDVVTTSLTIALIVDESVSEDVVYEMAKAMWDNIDTLKRAHSALKDASIEGAVQNIAGLPLHPGAAKFYREKGVLN